jgi:hypothetical protein
VALIIPGMVIGIRTGDACLYRKGRINIPIFSPVANTILKIMVMVNRFRIFMMRYFVSSYYFFHWFPAFLVPYL